MIKIARVSKKIITAIAICFLGIYCFFVEPYWIQETHLQFQTKLRHNYRVLQLSDLHIKTYSQKEKLILKKAKEQKPDFIFITGDMIVPNAKKEHVIHFLQDLRKISETIVVGGNWEYWLLTEEEKIEIYKQARVLYLKNENRLIKQELCILGLDDLEGQPLLEKSLRGCEASLFRIALFHSPAWFDDVVGDSFDLGLAGHTHGGQMRLPFYTPFTPPGSGEYVSGLYKKDKIQMYVSRGLGQSVIQARFFARPEIVIIDLLKK